MCFYSTVQTRGDLAKQGQYVSQEMFYGGGIPEMVTEEVDDIFGSLDMSVLVPKHRKTFSDDKRDHPPLSKSSILIEDTVLAAPHWISQTLPWYSIKQCTAFSCAYFVFLLVVICLVMGITGCQRVDDVSMALKDEASCLIMNLLIFPLLCFWSCSFGINALGFPCCPKCCTFDRDLQQFIRFTSQNSTEAGAFIEKAQLQASQNVRKHISCYKNTSSGASIEAGLWVRINFTSVSGVVHDIAFPLLMLENETTENRARNWDNDSSSLPHIRCARVETDYKYIALQALERVPNSSPNFTLEYSANWHVSERSILEATVMALKIRDYLGKKVTSVELVNKPATYSNSATFSKESTTFNNQERTCGSPRYWIMMIASYTGLFSLFYCYFRSQCPILHIKEYIHVELVDDIGFDNLVKAIDKRIASADNTVI